MLECEFHELDSRLGHQLIDRKFNTAQHLLSLLAPISKIPPEIQGEILLLAIQSTGHSPMQLMQVCRSWRAVVEGMSCLWSSLKLGAWTAHERVAFALERSGVWPLEVEIDTIDDVKNVNRSPQRFMALAATIPTMPRWKTLKLVSFSASESNSTIKEEEGLVSQLSWPLSRLESFTMLISCPSSPFVDTLLSTISTTSKATLRAVQVPCPGVISRIIRLGDDSIFHNLTSLKVQDKAMTREVERVQLDFLPQMTCVEVLELTSVLVPTYPLNTALPLVQTLWEMSLTATSIQWLFGRGFCRLESCTIISPLRIDPSDCKEINLPSCRELVYDGHPFDTLRRFNLPTVTTLSLRSNEWTGRADQKLDWIRAGLAQQRFTMINSLSIHLTSFSENALVILSRLSLLQQFTLRMAEPTGLNCKVLRRFCAKPLVRSDIRFYTLGGLDLTMSGPSSPSTVRLGSYFGPTRMDE